MKTKTVRIYWQTFRKLRRQIPPRKDEKLSDYFERVRSRLKDEKN